MKKFKEQIAKCFSVETLFKTFLVLVIVHLLIAFFQPSNVFYRREKKESKWNRPSRFIRP